MSAEDETKNLPDAVAPADLKHLILGAPFAIAGDAEFLPADAEKGIVGSVTCVRCECGGAFKVDLLARHAVACPKCKAAYTHVLVVCRTDDTEMFDDIVVQVLEANGIEPPEEETDTDENDDDDDGEADDDDDDSDDE